MEHVDAAEITRFLQGQLSPERAATVERHLATCQSCAQLLSVESEPVTEVPPDQASYVTGTSYAGPASPPPLAAEATPKWLQEGRTPDRGEQVGRYLILERVGQGGMGIVYAAWDPNLGRRVAIKLLRTDKQHSEGRTVGQARLLREAKAMARVSHPHVIPVFDADTIGEGVFVAMEFVDGTTLKKWIKEKERPWREVLDTFMAAGRGLASAHSVGLVHRDFKPDNVLIGKDGRIRVTDFGLARLAEEGAEAPSPALPEGAPVDEGSELGQITLLGHAVGTLMYMSPEQRRGDAPDARADQFSFCVALYWALFGVWPFDRQRLPARDDYSPASSHKGTSRPSQRTGEPRPIDPATGAFEPPRDSKVPAAIRRALMRGLSPEPKDRFASMEALLGQLEYRPRAIRRAAAAATLALVASVGGYTWYAQQQAARQQALVCTGAEQQLSGIWDEPTRRQITEALLATGKPNAADVASRVTDMLDRYARGWVEASTEACRATRVRGEQTEQLLSLRVVCLERRLKDVKAVAGVLASADAALVGKAAEAVSLLPSLASCADVTSLTQVEPLPDSPQAREEIGRITGQVAQLKALTDAGRYKQAKAVAEPAVKAAIALGYRPLEAEALLWQGAMEGRSGEHAAGEQHLLQASWAALASRSDAVLARAAAMLVFTIGFDPNRLEASLQWSELARAVIARMGGNEEMESELLTYVAVTYMRQQKNAEAIASLQKALQLAERALGPDHVRRASILGNMGNVLRLEGRYAEASRALTEAIAIRERVSGPKHPIGGLLHFATAQALHRTNELEKAQAHASRALEIQLEIYGADHPEVADVYDLQGLIHVTARQYREAQAAYQKAMEIKQKKLSKDDSAVGYTVWGLGTTYFHLGEPARALPLFERILTLSPPDPTLHGDTYFGMAQAQAALGKKRPQVLALAQKARAAYASVKDQEAVAQVDDWIAKHASGKESARTTRRK